MHKLRIPIDQIPFDHYCQIGESDWPELSDLQQQVCKQNNLVPIFDAETTLVALVPSKYADILLEIINRFTGDQ